MLKLAKQSESFYLIKRIYKEYLNQYISKLFIAVFFMILVAATNAAFTSLVKPILDKIFFNKDENMLKIVMIILMLITITKAIGAYYQNYYIRFVGQKLVFCIQNDLYKHLIKADIAKIHNISTGKLISKLTNDVNLLRFSIATFFTGVAKELFTVFFLFIVMLYFDSVLTLITFTVFPAVIFFIIKLGQRMRRVSESTQEHLAEYTAKLDDSFSSIRLIKAFNRENFEIKKARLVLEKIFNFYVNSIKIESLSLPIIELFNGFAIAFIVWYGGHQVITGNTSAGSFFAFVAAFLTAYKPIKNLSDLNTNLQAGLAAAKRIFEVLDLKNDIKNVVDAKKIILSKGEIKCSDLTFYYPESKTGLHKISMKIDGGKTTALVGVSGSGKSTFINLLLRLYDTSSGAIEIDGQNIKNVEIKSLRDVISYVSQDHILSDEDVLSNIKYGKLNASNDELQQALELADAKDFVNNLPNKLMTKVGQNGNMLSGGQKQRIAIARAMIKNAPILIFDEATSSLDNITENNIIKKIQSTRANKTNIIIAHRLSTIINADKIIVFSNGRIVEEGTHDELIKKQSVYQKLYKAKSV